MSVPLHRPFVREVYILVITTQLVRPEISKKLTLPPLEVAGYEAMFILLLLMLPLHCDGTVHCLDGDLIGGELLDIQDQLKGKQLTSAVVTLTHFFSLKNQNSPSTLFFKNNNYVILVRATSREMFDGHPPRLPELCCPRPECWTRHCWIGPGIARVSGILLQQGGWTGRGLTSWRGDHLA